MYLPFYVSIFGHTIHKNCYFFIQKSNKTSARGICSTREYGVPLVLSSIQYMYTRLQKHNNNTKKGRFYYYICMLGCFFFLSLCVLLYLCILCNIINYVAFFFVTEKNLYILAQVFSVSRPKGILYLFMPFSFFLFVSC